MRAIGLARRYARALLEAAAKKGVMEEVGQEFDLFLAVLDREPKLRFLLLSPEVSRDRKQEILRQIAQGWMSELFLRFLLVLTNARREALVRDIRGEYERLMDRKLGRVRAETVTAVPLEEEVAEALRRRMSAILGSEVALRSRVDPEILGGLVVRVDGKVFDASLRRRLERLRQELLSTQLPVEANLEVRNADQTG